MVYQVRIETETCIHVDRKARHPFRPPDPLQQNLQRAYHVLRADLGLQTDHPERQQELLTYLERVGKLLFASIFPDGWPQRWTAKSGLQLQLAPCWQPLPWELLHDGQHWLALQRGVWRCPLFKPPTGTPPRRSSIAETPTNHIPTRVPQNVQLVHATALPLAPEEERRTTRTQPLPPHRRQLLPLWSWQNLRWQAATPPSTSPSTTSSTSPSTATEAPGTLIYQPLAHAQWDEFQQALQNGPRVVVLNCLSNAQGWLFEDPHFKAAPCSRTQMATALKRGVRQGLEVLILIDSLGLENPEKSSHLIHGLLRDGLPALIHLRGRMARSRLKEYVLSLSESLAQGLPLQNAHRQALSYLEQNGQPSWDWIFPQLHRGQHWQSATNTRLTGTEARVESAFSRRLSLSSLPTRPELRTAPQSHSTDDAKTTASPPQATFWPPPPLLVDRRRLFGRAAILRQLERTLLGHQGTPVRLIGSAGSGKTSLALELIRRLQRQFDQILLLNGEAFSPLANASPHLLEDPGPSLIDVLWHQLGGSASTAGRWTEQELAETLQDGQRRLIILDRIEKLTQLEAGLTLLRQAAPACRTLWLSRRKASPRTPPSTTSPITSKASPQKSPPIPSQKIWDLAEEIEDLALPPIASQTWQSMWNAPAPWLETALPQTVLPPKPPQDKTTPSKDRSRTANPTLALLLTCCQRDLLLGRLVIRLPRPPRQASIQPLLAPFLQKEPHSWTHLTQSLLETLSTDYLQDLSPAAETILVALALLRGAVHRDTLQALLEAERAARPSTQGSETLAEALFPLLWRGFLDSYDDERWLQLPRRLHRVVLARFLTPERDVLLRQAITRRYQAYLAERIEADDLTTPASAPFLPAGAPTDTATKAYPTGTRSAGSTSASNGSAGNASAAIGAMETETLADVRIRNGAIHSWCRAAHEPPATLIVQQRWVLEADNLIEWLRFLLQHRGHAPASIEKEPGKRSLIEKNPSEQALIEKALSLPRSFASESFLARLLPLLLVRGAREAVWLPQLEALHVLVGQGYTSATVRSRQAAWLAHWLDRFEAAETPPKDPITWLWAADLALLYQPQRALAYGLEAQKQAQAQQRHLEEGRAWSLIFSCRLPAGELTAGQPTTGQLTTGQLAADSITTGQISTSQITAGQVAASEDEPLHPSRAAAWERFQKRFDALCAISLNATAKDGRYIDGHPVQNWMQLALGEAELQHLSSDSMLPGLPPSSSSGEAVGRHQRQNAAANHLNQAFQGFRRLVEEQEQDRHKPNPLAEPLGDAGRAHQHESSGEQGFYQASLALASLALRQGENHRALMLLQEAIGTSRNPPHRHWKREETLLKLLAERFRHQQSNTDEALKIYAALLHLHELAGNLSAQIACLDSLATLHLKDRNDSKQAARFYGRRNHLQQLLS